MFIYSLLSQLSFSFPVSPDARHISEQHIHSIKNQKDEHDTRRNIRLRIQLCPHLGQTATQTWRCQHWAACQAEDTAVSFTSGRLCKSHVAWAGKGKRERLRFSRQRRRVGPHLIPRRTVGKQDHKTLETRLKSNNGRSESRKWRGRCAARPSILTASYRQTGPTR